MTTHAATRTATAVTLVTSPGCHYCDDAHTHLRTLIEDGTRIELTVIEATSAEGRSLLDAHRPAMYPLVLIDGDYFSAGRLPRRKLDALLQHRAVETETLRHG